MMFVLSETLIKAKGDIKKNINYLRI